MSGIFEHLDMFDEQEAVATRQAIAVANKRFDDTFGSFLRQASTKKEFESRLALVDTDINNMVADVTNEYGGDAEKIAAAVKESFLPALLRAAPAAIGLAGELFGGDDEEEQQNEDEGGILDTAKDAISIFNPGMANAMEMFSSTKTATCDCDGTCEGMCKCGGCDSCKCSNQKEAKDKRPEHLKAQDEIQKADEHSEVPPWLKKQDDDEDQEDGGNRKDSNRKEAFGFGDIAEGIGGAVGDVVQTGQDIGGAVSDAAGAVGDAASAAGGAIGQAADAVTNPIGDAANAVGDFAGDVAQGAGQVAGDIAQTGQDVAGGINDAANAIGQFGSDVAALPGQAVNAVGDFGSEMLQRGAEGYEQGQQGGNTFTKIPDAAGAIGDAASGAANWVGQEGQYLGDRAQQGYQNSITSSTIGDLFKASKDNWVNEGDTVTNGGESKKVKDIEQAGSEKVVRLEDGSTEDIDDVEVSESKVATKSQTGDSTEKRESLPKGDEDALGGPSPKMDKKKWVPNATNPEGNLKPIDTEGENSPVPTRNVDIKEKPDYQNNDPWENDNKVWEREELPVAKNDEAGFETTRNIDQPNTKTYPNKGQANPVTRKALAAWYDQDSLFRRWLADHGVELTDDPSELVNSPVVRSLWHQFVKDVPAPEEGEEVIGAPAEGQEVMPSESIADEEIVEDVLEEPIEEPVEEEMIIEETPEDIEGIIEREDKEGDRVEVIDEGDEDTDLLDEELNDPFADAETMSDEELESLLEDYEEDPDKYL